MDNNDKIEELQKVLKTLSLYFPEYTSLPDLIEDIKQDIKLLKDAEKNNKINLAKSIIEDWRDGADSYVYGDEKEKVIWYVDFLEKKLQK